MLTAALKRAWSNPFLKSPGTDVISRQALEEIQTTMADTNFPDAWGSEIEPDFAEKFAKALVFSVAAEFRSLDPHPHTLCAWPDSEQKTERLLFELFDGGYGVDVRRNVLAAIVALASKHSDWPAGLAILSFLEKETDPFVLTRAALEVCVFTFPAVGDPVPGGGYVVDAIRRRIDDPQAAGSLAAGLLVTGDPRFRRHWLDGWEALCFEGKRQMLRFEDTFARREACLWLTDLLRQNHGKPIYPHIAARIALIADHADKMTGVFDLERIIPVSLDPEHPVVNNAVLSRQEFYEAEFKEILDGLEKQEEDDEELVMPMVQLAWSDGFEVLQELWRRLEQTGR